MSDYQCGTAYSFYYANDFFIGFYNDDIKSFEVSSELYNANSCTGVTKYVAVQDEPESKPVYTQAMCDAGALPSVGMECCYSSSSMVIWNECTVIAYYDGFVWTSDNGIRPLANTRFKPLTPPIELIDGKAYQFYIEGFLALGFYRKDRKSFFSCGNKVCGLSEVDEITLLTPEK